MAQKIAVLVPGITGSTLIHKTDQKKDINDIIPVWPTQVAADPGNAASLLNQDDLVAGWPILETVKKDAKGNPVPVPVYAGIIAYFTRHLFIYRTSPDGVTVLGNQLVGFGYDWREPNATTADTLNTWLGTIASKASPGAEIWLIGHSMGGLVSRYLLETGMSMASKVKGLITLGTPHLGAPLALSAITGECDLSDLLNPEIVAEVVDLPQYPSGFELLPPSQITFVKDAAAKDYGVYNGPVNQLLTAAPPSGFGAPAASFTDALNFFKGLKYGKTAPAGVPTYRLVYSTGLDSVTGFTYTPNGATPKAKLSQNARSGNKAGDGIVPQTSAMFTGGWVLKDNVFSPSTAVPHGQLPNNPEILKQVGTWMGLANPAADAPADDAPSAAELMEPALVG